VQALFALRCLLKYSVLVIKLLYSCLIIADKEGKVVYVKYGWLVNKLVTEPLVIVIRTWQRKSKRVLGLY
jgi:hypothetical protein